MARLGSLSGSYRRRRMRFVKFCVNVFWMWLCGVAAFIQVTPLQNRTDYTTTLDTYGRYIYISAECRQIVVVVDD